MWLPVLAFIVGFITVYLLSRQAPVPAEYAPYIGVAVVAGFDSIVGAIRSAVEGKFNDHVFVSGFFTNAAIAALLLYLGNSLRLQYVALAIMVALIIRIFNNLGFVRRYIVARLFEKRLTADSTFPEP